MFWSLMLNKTYGLGGTPAEHHWMPQMKEITEFVRGMIQLPCHIVFTAHLDVIEDKTLGGLAIFPKTTGKLRTEIPNWFNEVYLCQRLENEDAKIEYSWQTIGTGRENFLKSSLNQLGKYWEDPIIVDWNKRPVGVEMLLQKRFGKEDT